MAYQVKTPAKGNATNTGAPGPTPAPTKPQAPDVISEVRKGGDGYGQNSGPANPSPIEPGRSVMSPLAANLKASVDDDGCLDRVIRDGTARQDESVTSQLRTIAAGNVPNHPNMTGAKPGPKVPGKIG